MTTTAAVPVQMRGSRWPWVVAALSISMALIGVWLFATRSADPFDIEVIVYVAAIAAFSVVGALIVSRIRGHLIGSLFLVIGFGSGLTLMTDLWVLADPPLPARGWLALLNHAAIPMSIGALPFVLLRFPDGKIASPRWRWIERFAIAATVSLTIGALLVPTFPEYRVDNPIGIGGAEAWDAIAGIAWLLFLPTVVLAGASQVFRFRASGGEQRERLKWFALGGLLLALGWVAFVFAFDGDDSDLGSRLLRIPFYVGLTAFPILCGIAILRYRLFDIDVAIRRTVVFGALAAFIAAVYIAIVVGLGAAIGARDEQNMPLQIAATAIVALAFEPVHVRVTRWANRLVYGERATPYEVMAAVSRRVAETVSVVDLLPDMARAAASGIAASVGRVRLKLPHGERVVWWPDSASEDREPGFVTVVRYAGAEIGDIAVWKPAGETVTPGERALLEDLGAQAGLALHNVRLTEELAIRTEDLAVQNEELRRSRERLVTARDVQRRRLEQDIREGPQRHLLAIAGAVGEATSRLENDPDGAVATLDELGDRATSTLEGLRDLARGIFPPLLADEGIVAALEAHIRKVGASAELEVDPSVRNARFDPEIEATGYFFCLQAMQNVIRHADNAMCTVSILRDGDALAFRVSDEGPGFDPAVVPRGMGMQIMEDRVEALGGTFAVRAASGVGTTVEGEIPLRAHERVPE
jgi:signal transduction histidine kinase